MVGEGQLRWEDDPVLSVTDIDSPVYLRYGRRHHATSRVLAQMDYEFRLRGVGPEVEAMVSVMVSNDHGACPVCRAGLSPNSGVDPGPIKVFSDRYPNLTIVIQSPVLPDLVVRGGAIMGLGDD